MIKSFRSRPLKRLFERGDASGVNPDHVRKLRLILARLNAAKTVADINFPGSGLHPLKGALAGHHAVSVSGNWRVTFRLEDGETHEIDYTDYH